MDEVTYRLPAEWEPQSGVLLCWPHPRTDWADTLAEVEPCVAAMVAAISRFEQVLLIVDDAGRVRPQLAAAGSHAERVRLVELPTNDTWARDFAAITVQERDTFRLLDFGFNGWGLKFAADLDNTVNRRLHAMGELGTSPMSTLAMILEGGSIESDGAGSILTTADCLLSANRNPHMSQQAIEAELCRRFGARQVLWLHHGHLAGDDTDSHIDILARFAPGETIVHMHCDDPGDAHYPAFDAMLAELAGLRNADGRPYRLVALPWPRPRHNRHGELVAPSYANFLVINDAVLVPVYGDASDDEALQTIAACFPAREVIGIDASPLLEQGGSLHCMTMQFPLGVLP